MASSDLFSVEIHKNLKKKVENSYFELIQDLREDMESGFESPHLTEEFQKSFKEIIKNKALDSFSPLAFYWANLLENLIYAIQLHEDGENAEEDIFDFWNESEYAANFQELLNTEDTLLKASESLRVLLENQVLSFFYLHLDKDPGELDNPLLYRVIPEIGDHPQRIYLGNDHRIVDIDPASDLFPNIALTNFSENKTKIEVEIEKAYFAFDIKKPIAEIDQNLYLIPQCKSGGEHYKEFKESILKALEIIKSSSPDCYNVFKSFTHSIIPVNETGVVSYSMQSLPGYSCINLFDRDFVDLLDDLIHENGHHYLNTYLNFTDLINEDDEKIFYSPWRRSLRPIRGIYHAVFTFYWALKLFFDLSKNLDQFSNEEEKQKVLMRAVEEYNMLDYCQMDLKLALKDGKVTNEGNELISLIYENIHSLKSDIDIFEKKLSSKNLDKINELKTTLKEKREHYSL